MWRELHTTEPFLDLRVLGGNRPLLLTYLRTLLTMTITYAYLYGFSQWLQDGRGLGRPAPGWCCSGCPGGAIVSRDHRPAPGGPGQADRRGRAAVRACGVLLLLDGTSALWLLVGVAVLAGCRRG